MAQLTDEDIAAIRRATSITFKHNGDAATIVCDGAEVPAGFRRALAFYAEAAAGIHSVAVRSHQGDGAAERGPLELTIGRADAEPAWRTIAELLQPGDGANLYWSAEAGEVVLRLVVCRLTEPKPLTFVVGHVLGDSRPPSPEPASAPAALAAVTPAAVRLAPAPSEGAPQSAAAPPREARPARPERRRRALAVALALVAGAAAAAVLGVPIVGGAIAGVSALRAWVWARQSNPSWPARVRAGLAAAKSAA